MPVYAAPYYLKQPLAPHKNKDLVSGQREFPRKLSVEPTILGYQSKSLGQRVTFSLVARL
jgi:hypothetical protein